LTRGLAFYFKLASSKLCWGELPSATAHHSQEQQQEQATGAKAHIMERQVRMRLYWSMLRFLVLLGSFCTVM
jgi:hypothetical protein